MKKYTSDVNNPMFAMGDTLLHVKTGKHCCILTVPNEIDTLEYCNLPFYSYKEILGSPKIWYRAQTNMEDGRFIKHE